MATRVKCKRHETGRQDTSLLKVNYPKLTIAIHWKIIAMEIRVIAHQGFVAEIHLVVVRFTLDFSDAAQSLYVSLALCIF